MKASKTGKTPLIGEGWIDTKVAFFLMFSFLCKGFVIGFFLSHTGVL